MSGCPGKMRRKRVGLPVHLTRFSGKRLPQSVVGVIGVVVFGIVVAVAVPSAFGKKADLPGVPERPDLISLTPVSQTNWVGEEVTHTATISANEPAEHRVGVTVTFTVLQGPSEGRTFTAVTDSNGAASFTYTIPAPNQPLATLPNAGADQIQASFFDGSDIIGSNWAGQGWSKAAFGLAVPDRPPALIKEPGATSFSAANPTQDLPPGTTVDISGDRGLSIINYAGRKMTFLGVPDRVASRFTLINGLRSPGKPIRIKLAGGRFNACTPNARSPQVHSRSAQADKKKPGKPVRRLWASGKGRYITSGKYASAEVRGTFWLVSDYCDGTLVKVRSGTVIVTNLATKQKTVIKSGHAVFIKKPS